MTVKTAMQLKAQLGANDPVEFQRDMADSAWLKGEVASQAEAEAGVATDKVMTPERVAQAIAALGGVGYLAYLALLTQTGTNAPVATVLNSSAPNYLGDIVWSRLATGNYAGTKANAFPASTFVTRVIHAGVDSVVYCARTGVNTLEIYSQILQGGEINFIDGMIANVPIEIRVYP